MNTNSFTYRKNGSNVIGMDAVKYGLINEVGGIGPALQKLNELIEINRKQKAEGDVIQ